VQKPRHFLAKVGTRCRVDYQDAYAAEQGATEYAPDGKAAQEIRDLWRREGES
jgi:chromosome partitioning protein